MANLESKLVQNGLDELLEEYLSCKDGGSAEAWLNIGEKIWDQSTDLRSSSIDCFKKAADGGCAKAQCRLAGIYENGIVIKEDLKKARHWYLESAAQGDEEAQYSLGWMIADEKVGDEDSDKWFAMSLRTYMAQAQAGVASAAFRVGFMFMKGLGVGSDQERSEEFFLLASELGDLQALHTLGSEFRNGGYFKKDPKKAVRYFKQAADAGDKSSYYALAEAYERGFGGLGVDLPVSLFWYEKCVEGGSRLAVKKVKEVSMLINESQVQE